jgi:hypothetical protein
LDNHGSQPRSDSIEAPTIWTAKAEDWVSSLSHTLQDAAKNPIVETAAVTVAVLIAFRFRQFLPTKNILPELKLVALKNGILTADDSAISLHGSIVATLDASSAKPILATSKTSFTLQKVHPNIDIGALEFKKPTFPRFAERLNELPTPVDIEYTKKTLPFDARLRYSDGTISIDQLADSLQVDQAPANFIG